MRAVAPLLVAGLLAACMPSSDAITDRSWTLVEIAGSVPVADAGLTFGPDGRLTVQPGCNSGGGTYAIEGNRITTEAIALTEMACGEPADAQEREFVRILEGDPLFEIETRTGRLRLTAGDAALVFVAP